jgi:hypothetical protein
VTYGEDGAAAGKAERGLAGRLSLASFASLAIAVVTLLALSAPALAAPPDNRAYEMVSPVEKGGYSLLADIVVADASGEHVIVDGGPANSLIPTGFSWMLESRTATGWSGVQVGPPAVPGTAGITQDSTQLVAVSQDVSSVAFQMFVGVDPRDRNSPPGVRIPGEGGFPVEDVPSNDVYVRRGPAEPFMWASGPPAPIVKTAELPQPECFNTALYCALNSAVFAGGSSDLSTIVWSQGNPLVAPPGSLPGSPADTHQHGNEVYSSTNGASQRLVGLVPAAGSQCGPGPGSCVVPSCGAAMGNASETGSAEAKGFAPTEGAVSGDGSQVVFTSPDAIPYNETINGTTNPFGCAPPEIFVRDSATTTVQVSESQKAHGDPSGPKEKVYAGASEEGGRLNTVFFTSKEALTNNANTGSEDQGNDLYAYNLTKPAGERLTDLTPVNNTIGKRLGPFGEVIESVEATLLGASTNGKLVYFTASSELTAEPNSQGAKAQAGASNLYVYDANTGTTRFVAPGSGIKGVTPIDRNGGANSQVTPDGRHLVFLSSEHISSDDKLSPACPTENAQFELVPGFCAEVYLYDAPANRVVCVSCDPSGAPPTSSAALPAQIETISDYLTPPRFVSDNGERVFFNSSDQLTPDAPPPTTSKAKEVGSIQSAGPLEFNAYEYQNGHVNLIAPAATISTVTPSGNDVFFYSFAQLVPQDRDATVDIYDARVGGGFPALAAPVCSGTSCQGAPAPAPVFATPAGVTFHGVGNFPPSATKPKPKTCKKGFVRRRVKKHSRCVRKPAAKRAARSNRRGR